MRQRVKLDELKQNFDKVFLTHDMNPGGRGGRTSVILVKGDVAYGGTATCSKKYQFNRALGRQVAIGRALHAFAVVNKGKRARTRTDYSSFTAQVVSMDADHGKITLDRETNT